MRPATAVSKNSQISASSIWKTHESFKPQKNQFYCFKTISQILDSHHSKTFRDDKKKLYYHKANPPAKQYRQNQSFKQNTQKKISTVINRNPTLKKVLQTKFFSSKQIKKQNTDLISMTKITSQIKIGNEPKFLPYRQQAKSIIKNSKILNQQKNFFKSQDKHKKRYQNASRPYTKAGKKQANSNQIQKAQSAFNQSKNLRKSDQILSEQDSEFMIQKWENFEEESGTFSILINNWKRLN